MQLLERHQLLRHFSVNPYIQIYLLNTYLVFFREINQNLQLCPKFILSLQLFVCHNFLVSKCHKCIFFPGIQIIADNVVFVFFSLCVIYSNKRVKKFPSTVTVTSLTLEESGDINSNNEDVPESTGGEDVLFCCSSIRSFRRCIGVQVWQSWPMLVAD